MKDMFDPIHPGEILLEDFLKPLGLSAAQLALEIDVDAALLEQIVERKHDLTKDIAEKLTNYFGNSCEFWIGLQEHYKEELRKQ